MCTMCTSAPESVCASLHSLLKHGATALYTSVHIFEALTRRHGCSQALTLLHPWLRCCSILVAWQKCGMVEEADERQANAATCCHSSFATSCFRGTPACFTGTPRCSNASIKSKLRFWVHLLLCMARSSSCIYVKCLLLRMHKTLSLCAKQLVCVHVRCSTC